MTIGFLQLFAASGGVTVVLESVPWTLKNGHRLAVGQLVQVSWPFGEVVGDPRNKYRAGLKTRLEHGAIAASCRNGRNGRRLKSGQERNIGHFR